FIYVKEHPSVNSFYRVGVEQLEQRNQARLGRRASGLATRRLYPVTEMRHDSGKIIPVPVTQKEWHTPGRQQLSDLMKDGLRHRQGALADLDVQQQLGLGLDRRPDPVGRPRKPLDRLGCPDVAVSYRTEHGVEFIE